MLLSNHRIKENCRGACPPGTSYFPSPSQQLIIKIDSNSTTVVVEGVTHTKGAQMHTHV